ncbi:hypothetical protein GCM10010151_66200 [Actinoallomurus spadix]|uniref:Outer membrane channel protein CpnT-like N-terminal domain-containing protein n=1 Tax=Actinoallomurus spadix TaxID=79912 RepID=A0ABN0XLB0_9ACTN
MDDFYRAMAAYPWGTDDLGRSMFEGDKEAGRPGFAQRRDGLVKDLTWTVNHLYRMGAGLEVSGGTYKEADGTIVDMLGGRPHVPASGRAAVPEHYTPPHVAGGMRSSSPPPDGWVWLEKVLGYLGVPCQWPEADLDGLAGLRDAARTMKTVVKDVHGFVAANSSLVTKNGFGAATDAFDAKAKRLHGDGMLLESLAARCDELAGYCEGARSGVVKAREQCAVTLAFVIGLMIFAGPLGGAVEAWAERRILLQGLGQKLVLNVIREAVLGMAFMDGTYLIDEAFNWDGLDLSDLTGLVGHTVNGAVAGGLMGLGRTGLASLSGKSDALDKFIALSESSGKGGIATRYALNGTIGTTAMYVAGGVSGYGWGLDSLGESAGMGFGMALTGTGAEFVNMLRHRRQGGADPAQISGGSGDGSGHGSGGGAPLSAPDAGAPRREGTTAAALPAGATGDLNRTALAGHPPADPAANDVGAIHTDTRGEAATPRRTTSEAGTTGQDGGNRIAEIINTGRSAESTGKAASAEAPGSAAHGSDARSTRPAGSAERPDAPAAHEATPARNAAPAGGTGRDGEPLAASTHEAASARNAVPESGTGRGGETPAASTHEAAPVRNAVPASETGHGGEQPAASAEVRTGSRHPVPEEGTPPSGRADSAVGETPGGPRAENGPSTDLSAGPVPAGEGPVAAPAGHAPAETRSTPRSAEPPHHASASGVAEGLAAGAVPAARSGDLVVAPEHAAATTHPGSEAAVAEPKREIRPPRHADGSVRAVAEPKDVKEVVRRWADEAFPDHLPRRVRAEIERRATEALTGLDREAATDLIYKGTVFAANGHVVRLRLRPADYVNMETPEGARIYHVDFGGSGAGMKRSEKSHTDLVAGDVEIMETSDSMEAIGTPLMNIERSASRIHDESVEVMAGHKSVAYAHDSFITGKVDLVVEVDGAELAGSRSISGLSMVVDFPAELHREGPAVPGDDRPPAPRHRVPADRAGLVRQHDVRFLALDCEPLVPELTRRALQAGVSPRKVVRLIERALANAIDPKTLLNQARNLRDGPVTTNDVTIESRVIRLERMSDSDLPNRLVVLRDDQGLVKVTTEAEHFGATWKPFFGFKVGGGANDAELFLRAGVGIQVGTDYARSLVLSNTKHTVFVRKVDVAGYHGTVRMQVKTEFGTFPVDVAAFMTVPEAESAAFFEAVTGKPAAEDVPAGHPGSTAPEGPSGSTASGDPSGSTAGHAHSPAVPDASEAPPVVNASRGPVAAAEPPQLAAGRGAGMGSLREVNGTEHLVPEVIDTAFADLPEKTRDQLRRELEAQFGPAALTGQNVSDLAHGNIYEFEAGGRHVKVTLDAEVGATRGTREYDMTVNERKAAGSTVAGAVNTGVGAGAQVAANVRGSLPTTKLGRFAVRFGADVIKVLGHLGFNRWKGLDFFSNWSEYSRFETEGPVTEFTKDLRVNVRVQVSERGTQTLDRSWVVEGTDVTAQVVVPHQFAPQWKMTPEETAGLGRVEEVEELPKDLIGFDGQTTGVFFSSAGSKELTLGAARIVAEAHGEPAPAHLSQLSKDQLLLPSDIDAHLAELTSPTGWKRVYTAPDGTRRTVILKLDVGAPKHITIGTGVESEHYRAAGTWVRTSTNTGIGAEAAAGAGGRVKVEAGHVSGKAVAAVEGGLDRHWRYGGSETLGGSDVVRGTYSSDGLNHRFSESDLYLSVTPVTPEGAAPTRHLLAHAAGDFMVPDRIAHDLGLALTPDIPPPAEPRTFDPNEAMTSALVERFHAREVLPAIEKLVRGQGIDPKTIERELEAAFSEPALAAKIASLEDGVSVMLPVKSGAAYGLSENLGIRVRLKLPEGDHTAERSELTHMARNQGRSSSDANREKGSGWTGKAHARATAHVSEKGTGGGEVGGTRSSQSHTGSRDGVMERDINRRQTQGGSHEFTFKDVEFEIEVAKSSGRLPGLDQAARAARAGLGAIARLIADDAALRWWDRVDPVSIGRATVHGNELRLVVPDHLTRPAAEGERVPGTTRVRAENARWADAADPLASNTTVAERFRPTALPGAKPLLDQVLTALLPPELRGPTPGESGHASGYELGRIDGQELIQAVDRQTLMTLPQMRRLLSGDGVSLPGGLALRMDVPDLTIRQVISAKMREYTQKPRTHRDEYGHASNSGYKVGLSGGPEGDRVGLGSLGSGRGTSVGHETNSTNIEERNVEEKASRYVVDGTVHFEIRLPGAKVLAFEVTDGVQGLLAERDVAEFQRLHPGLIKDPDGLLQKAEQTAEQPPRTAVEAPDVAGALTGDTGEADPTSGDPDADSSGTG